MANGEDCLFYPGKTTFFRCGILFPFFWHSVVQISADALSFQIDPNLLKDDHFHEVY